MIREVIVLSLFPYCLSQLGGLGPWDLPAIASGGIIAGVAVATSNNAAAGADVRTMQPDIYGLINILYLKADSNIDGTITLAEFSNVFHGFDKNGDGNVTNAEFVEIWRSLTGQTVELANAYFHLADINDDQRIDSHDMQPMYTVFDLDGHGTVSAQEFATKWEDIIRETAFAVLFERADVNKDEFLTHAEFSNFLASFDTDHNGKVSNAEFDRGWQHADFALQSDADQLFSTFDSNHDYFITGQPDMAHLWTTYNVNGDNKMTLQETIQMKTLLVLHSNVQPGGR